MTSTDSVARARSGAILCSAKPGTETTTARTARVRFPADGRRAKVFRTARELAPAGSPAGAMDRKLSCSGRLIIYECLNTVVKTLGVRHVAVQREGYAIEKLTRKLLAEGDNLSRSSDCYREAYKDGHAHDNWTADPTEIAAVHPGDLPG